MKHDARCLGRGPEVELCMLVDKSKLHEGPWEDLMPSQAWLLNPPDTGWIAHPANGLVLDTHGGWGLAPLRPPRQLSAAARRRDTGVLGGAFH